MVSEALAKGRLPISAAGLSGPLLVELTAADAITEPGDRMLYSAYLAHRDLMQPVRAAAALAAAALDHPWGVTRGGARKWAAGWELVASAALTHRRPSFAIDRVTVGNRELAVREEAVFATPFATLLRLAKEAEAPQPRVLLIAPLSGHFATLLRGTAQTLLPEHDVYITDWHNARDVPLRHGRFGFDESIEHIMRFLEFLGPGAHVVAVCQPCVQALAATSLMAEAGRPAQPRSLTLMAGPIDTRINPTRVNLLATQHPIDWFERKLIDIVPPRFAGAGRRVYPGFVQLGAFMTMNLDRHVRAHFDLFDSLALGDRARAAATRSFYEEYFAVLDLAADFYLETVRFVFQEHRLPLGTLEWRGRKVNPRAIERTALFTVEGERDDICAIGQTIAAQELCSGLRPYLKRHHLQPGVGHYGVFSGKRWSTQIYPILRNVILSSE